jgi:hypothetical protein
LSNRVSRILPATVAETVRSACGPGSLLNSTRTAHRTPGHEPRGRGRNSRTSAAGRARIAEQEGALEERPQHADTLAAQASEAPPTAADPATAPGGLPVLANRLYHLLQQELRRCSTASRCGSPFSPAAHGPGGSAGRGRGLLAPPGRRAGTRARGAWLFVRAAREVTAGQ